MEGSPYPKDNFDLSLAAIDGRFVVETGSRKGAELVNNFRTFFKEVDPEDLKKRELSREGVSARLEEFIKERGTPDTTKLKGLVKKHYDLTELWEDFASSCVECGACNLVCPTCHCFLLFDEKSKNDTGRFRVWDSCLYKSFAGVAGGANPRKYLYERLRNRFDKKFDFFPQVLDRFACTGCGRCIEACPGNIDIREVLKGLVKGEWNKPPHE